MKRILKFSIYVLAFSIAALTLIVTFFPKERIFELASAKLEREIGRVLTYSGEPYVSLFPTLAVRIDDAKLSNASWSDRQTMLSAKNIDISVKLGSLIFGRVEPANIKIYRPKLFLEISKDGRKNWEIQRVGKHRGKSVTGDKIADKGKSGDDTYKQKVSDDEIPFYGIIKIIEGEVRFADHAKGFSHELVDLSLTLTRADISAPIKLDGFASYDEKMLALEFMINKQQADDTYFFEVSASSLPDANRVKFSGTYDKQILEGTYELKVNSFQSVSGLLNTDIPICKELSMIGRLHIDQKDQQARITGISGQIADSHIQGSVITNYGRKRPHFKIDLESNAIDLTKLLRRNGTCSSSSNVDFFGSKRAYASENPEQNKWSNKPINLSSLRGIDADINLKTEGIKDHKLTIGKAEIIGSLVNGSLRFLIKRANAYEGVVTGSLNAKISDVPSWKLVLSANKMDIGSALREMADLKMLDGKGELNAEISASGHSVADWVSSLAGTAGVSMQRGTVNGLDIIGAMRNVESALAGTRQEKQSHKTDFTEFDADFVIRNGIANSSNDIRLSGPFIRASGTGNFDIVNKQMHVRLKPIAIPVASSEEDDPDGLAFPITITGSWSRPVIKPDLQRALSDVLTDPDRFLRGLSGFKKTGKELERSLRDTTERLFKKDGNPAKEPAKAVQELLKTLPGNDTEKLGDSIEDVFQNIFGN